MSDTPPSQSDQVPKKDQSTKWRWTNMAYLLTYNNHHVTMEEAKAIVKEIEDYAYIKVYWELAPTTNLPHTHIMFVLKKRSNKRTRKMLQYKGCWPNCTAITCNNGIDKYEFKDGKSPPLGLWEEGNKKAFENVFKTNRKRQREKKDDYICQLRDLIMERGFIFVSRSPDTPEELLNCLKGCHALAMEWDKAWKESKEAKCIFREDELLPWQKHVLNWTNDPSKNTKILWVYDKDGRKGKSTLKQFLMEHRNAYAAQLTNVRDFGTEWNGRENPIIVFDLPRERRVEREFGIILENLQDGSIPVAKYQSTTYHFKPPIILVFSNETYPTGLLSAGRVHMLNIEKAPKIARDLVDTIEDWPEST